jgi:hypothetical protein
MKIHLCGAAGLFAEIALPAITTHAGGSDVVVTNQMVNIFDAGALKAFIQAVIHGQSAVLSLRNGKTTVSALGIGPRDIVFGKNIDFPGMCGPVVTLKAASLVQNAGNLASSMSALSAEQAAAAAKASAAGTSGCSASTSNSPIPTPSPTTGNFCSLLPINNTYVNITLAVVNPGPLEISFGMCHFDIENENGQLVAELKGRLDIRRNCFEVTIQGIVNRNVTSKLARDMMQLKKDKQQVAVASGASAKNKDHQKANDNENEKGAAVPEARLVGKRCAGAGWCDDSVKNINVSVHNMGILFRALGMEHDPEEIQRLTPPDAQEPVDGEGSGAEPGKKRGGFTGWTRRFGLH